jgi:hypothetical protein
MVLLIKGYCWWQVRWRKTGSIFAIASRLHLELQFLSWESLRIRDANDGLVCINHWINWNWYFSLENNVTVKILFGFIVNMCGKYRKPLVHLIHKDIQCEKRWTVSLHEIEAESVWRKIYIFRYSIPNYVRHFICTARGLLNVVLGLHNPTTFAVNYKYWSLYYEITVVSLFLRIK